MEAFHSFWSLPNSCRNRGEILFPDFEQLTAVLSALEWKKHSGGIRMITDSAGEAFLRSRGLTAFWDETEILLDPLKDLADPFSFWAAGKLYALRKAPPSCVMLDTDLIIWKNVEHLLQNDVTAAHEEELNPRTYPARDAFPLKNGYGFPAEWDFSLKAANTAFLHIRDTGFRDRYVDAAFAFLQNVETERLNPVQTMCFAEQRILPMCAAAEGKTLGCLMRPGEVFDQRFVTHIWGFKQVLRTNKEVLDAFCMRCVRRILTDFPEEAELLERCTDLAGVAARCRKEPLEQ